MSALVIVGAGGLGREVLQYARDAAAAGQGPDVKGFLDDNQGALDRFQLGVDVLGPIDDSELLSGDVVIAVGDPLMRHRLRQAVTDAGGTLTSVIHPAAWIAPSATLGDGCIVAPGAFIGVDAQIGRNVVVNALVSVGHDCTVGDDSSLSPHAALSGNSHVGEAVLLGTHATLMPGIAVGEGSRVAVAACVSTDLPAGSLAAGNPAKSRVMYRGKAQ